MNLKTFLKLVIYLVSFLAQLTMSARAFPITLCPSSVRLSVRLFVCPFVRLLDFFSKPISSYSFNQIALKFYTGINHKVAYPACAFVDDRIMFEFLAIFFIFEIMV